MKRFVAIICMLFVMACGAYAQTTDIPWHLKVANTTDDIFFNFFGLDFLQTLSTAPDIKNPYMLLFASIDGYYNIGQVQYTLTPYFYPKRRGSGSGSIFVPLVNRFGYAVDLMDPYGDFQNDTARNFSIDKMEDNVIRNLSINNFSMPYPDRRGSTVEAIRDSILSEDYIYNIRGSSDMERIYNIDGTSDINRISNIDGLLKELDSLTNIDFSRNRDFGLGDSEINYDMTYETYDTPKYNSSYDMNNFESQTDGW